MLGCDDDHHIPFLIMSDSEEYLDKLLREVGDGSLGDLDDDEFLRQFDSSILDEFKDSADQDAFLQELESELTGEEGEALVFDPIKSKDGENFNTSYYESRPEQPVIPVSEEELASGHSSEERLDQLLASETARLSASEEQLMTDIEELASPSAPESAIQSAPEPAAVSEPGPAAENIPEPVAAGAEGPSGEATSPGLEDLLVSDLDALLEQSRAENAEAAASAGGTAEMDAVSGESGEGASSSEDGVTASDLELDLSGLSGDMADPAEVAKAAAEGSGIQDENAAADSDSDDDLLSILNGLEDEEGELADIGNMLQKDEAGVENLSEEEVKENAAAEGLSTDKESGGEAAEETGKKKRGRKERKKKEKKPKGKGLFARIAEALFGPDEDELAAQAMADGLDDNEAIMRELDAAGEGDNPPDSKDDKKKKKKEKKPKKEKPKKEPKPKKEKPKKEPKPKKEKPPKKPKEKDTSPPLPKGPVVVTFIFAISILIFVVLASNFLGKDRKMADSKKAYEEKDYVTAYQQLAGLTLKEGEAEYYQKLSILSPIQEEYDSYFGLRAVNENAMALDCLIRGISRCSNYQEQAEAYGATTELAVLRDELVELLYQDFGLSAEDAAEIYALDGREDYSYAIERIIRSLGLEKEEKK